MICGGSAKIKGAIPLEEIAPLIRFKLVSDYCETLSAVSSMMKEVCNELSSVPLK